MMKKGIVGIIFSLFLIVYVHADGVPDGGQASEGSFFPE